jgi:hypothetical protein
MPLVLIMINLFIYYVIVFICLNIDVCYHTYYRRSDLTIPLEQTKGFKRTIKCLSPTTIELCDATPINEQSI